VSRDGGACSIDGLAWCEAASDADGAQGRWFSRHLGVVPRRPPLRRMEANHCSPMHALERWVEHASSSYVAVFLRFMVTAVGSLVGREASLLSGLLDFELVGTSCAFGLTPCRVRCENFCW
jgi:hypothetical protein